MFLTTTQIDKLIILFLTLTVIIYLTPADTLSNFLTTLVYTSIAVLRRTGTAIVYTSIFLGIGFSILGITMMILSCFKPSWYKKLLGITNTVLTTLLGTPPPRNLVADSAAERHRIRRQRDESGVFLSSLDRVHADYR